MISPTFASRKRSYMLASIIVILFGILFYRLYNLQFIEFDSFRSHAERNSIRRISREPLRGLIYDSDTNIIVSNNPSYTLTITPFEFKWNTLPLLAKLFNMDTNLVRYRLSLAGANGFEPVKIERNIPFNILSILEENRYRLPGVNYVVESRREYTMKPHLAHLLGYTKEISPFLLQKLGKYYQPGDMVGFNGIEAFYENILRGKKGYGFFTINSHGKVIENFENGQSDISAIEGGDLVLTIDMALQSYAENIMRNKLGAIVAIDPNNGEVLAFVSSPEYNLSDLSGKISYELWNSLNSNPGLPLYNRCSMAAYPPGSTFKMMLAVAALQERIIDERTTITCPGSYTLAGVTFKCHGVHGNVNVTRAIEYSCNVFFYKLIFKLGFQLWSKYGTMFHFGRKTGIDIANENPGVLPSESYYNKRYGTKWNKGYLVSLGIGQGEVNTTPLQMAAYTSTIANGGTFYPPHAVKGFLNRVDAMEQKIVVPHEKLPVASSVWRIVQNGMYRVVNGNGTGCSARLPGGIVAGKTGTAQNPHGRDHAWFVGYAPYKQPKIAIAVIIENGGFGGSAAAPIAAAVMRYFLSGSSRSTPIDSNAVTIPPSTKKPQKTPSIFYD